MSRLGLRRRISLLNLRISFGIRTVVLVIIVSVRFIIIYDLEQENYFKQCRTTKVAEMRAMEVRLEGKREW